MSEARKTVIKNLLEADATFMTLATGGIYTAVEISRQLTPAAFDGTTNEILPCCLVKAETTTPAGVYTHAGRLFIALIFYQRERTGHATIDAMRERAYALLQDACIEGLGAWSILWADDSADLEDPGTMWSMLYARYDLVIDRMPA